MGYKNNSRWSEDKDLPIFEFKVQEVLDPRKPKNVYIYAGKYLGKSIFLCELKKSLNQHDYEVELLHYNYERYKNFFEKFNSNEPKKNYALLVDDFDRFFIELIEKETDDFVQILNKSVEIKQNLTESQENYFILTGRNSPDLLLSNIEKKARVLELEDYFANEYEYSRFFMDWEHIPIFPWHPNWTDYVKFMLSSLFKEDLNQDVIDSWSKIICNLSGGHPLLLRLAMEEMVYKLTILEKKKQEIYGNNYSILSIEKKMFSSPVDRTLIEKNLEDILVNKSSGKFNRVFEQLKNFDLETYLLSFNILKRMANNSSFQPDNSAIRGILINNGLIYRSPDTNQYQIISKFLLDMLKGQEKAEFKKIPQIILKPFKEDKGQKGRLTIISHEKEINIPLTKIQLSVMKLLYSNKGNLVFYDQIESNTTLSGREVIRLTITRINKEFKALGLPNLIENVRGKGYIFKDDFLK